jgi:ATP-dependent DNA ligase
VTSGRLRHPARFLRWRTDREPMSCTMDQLAAPAPPEFTEIFGRADG